MATATRAPSDERDGNRQAKPTATAPPLYSTASRRFDGSLRKHNDVRLIRKYREFVTQAESNTEEPVFLNIGYCA